MKRLLLICTTVIVFWACNDESQLQKHAHILGEKHAAELIHQKLTDKQLAVKLLDVRAREQKIRTQTSQKVADIYIQSFTSYLRHNADSIALLIEDIPE